MSGCIVPARKKKDRGTDMKWIEAVSANEEVTFATAPLIFISTILSHCVSASLGREGAALQLGESGKPDQQSDEAG